MKQQLLALAAGYFASHPDQKEFHFTSDQQAFGILDHAKSHARELPGKDVVTITREEAEAHEKAEGAGKKKTEVPPAGETPSTKMNYQATSAADLRIEFTKRGLLPPDPETEMTHKELVAALKADDEKNPNP